MIGILYFSSTGNSLYISQKVQEAMGGKIKYIPTYLGDGSEFEKVVIVTPIYSYGMPTFVCDMLERLDKNVELFVIQNYGGMSGGADYLLYQYALKFGLNIKAVYTMKMPENFTTTFTVPQFYINSILKRCDARISKIVDSIQNNSFRLPKKKRTHEKKYLQNKANWHIIGNRLSANENCVGCGKCIDICPTSNIVMKGGKIVFQDKCVACLGCYHRCPQKAITYLGNNKKDRYVNPKVNEGDIGKDL